MVFCAFFVPFKTNKTASAVAAAQVKASAAYLDLNGSGNILNGFEGVQKEYVYMGTYGNAPVKWRVLAVKDTKYGSGNDNLLLWSDKQVGASQYNANFNSPNYAYWGTSKIWATLNGGYYAADGATGSNMPSMTDDNYRVQNGASIYGTLFADYEKSGVASTGSYITDNCAIDTSQSQYLYMKENITVNDYGVNGKYNQSIFGTGTAQYASTTAAGGVRETTSGDKLFILDYYDINSAAYGFGDSDGTTYATKINGSWTPSSDWYPSYYDNSLTSFNNKTSDYLKFSGDLTDTYWLRSSSRGDPAYSSALIVNSLGFVTGSFGASYSHGLRPAFNLDTSKVAYATASKPASGWTDMMLTTPNPEYNLYFKSSNYAANSSNAKATIAEKDGTLNISYNNPTGKTGGSIVLLLSDKIKTDGSVDWQTAVTMSSTSATDNKFVTVTLPSGVSLSTHVLTMLYTSSSAGNSTEEIYCSYAMDNSISAPSDISNLTYDGGNKWISDLSSTEKPAWLDLNIYNNNAFIKSVSVTYKDNTGSAIKTVETDEIAAAGEYEVTMTLADGLKWTGAASNGGDKKFKIVIGKADPKVTAKLIKEGNLYTTAGLPLNEDKTAAVKNAAEGGTSGTFAWVSGQTPSSTQSKYRCLFTPTDTNNYNTKECSVDITFLEDEISGISAAVEEDGTGENKLFTQNSLDKLKASPFNLKVTLVYASGYKETTSDYTLSVLKDGSPQNAFHAGANTVQVESNGYDCSFTVEVIAAEIDRVKSVDFNQNGKTIYPDTPLEDIKELFTVQVYWNYNTSKFETLDKGDFKLEGALVPGTGTSKLYIVYTKGGSEVQYEVPKGAIDKITVDYLTFDLSGVAFADGSADYDGTAHGLEITGGLPDGVTAEYNYACAANGYNSSEKPVDAGEYTVTVSFTHGNPNYGAITDVKTATLTINKVDYPDADKIIFADKTVTLGGDYTMEAQNVPDGVTVTYEGNDVSELGSYTVTAKFTHSNPNYNEIADKTATLTVTDKKLYDKSGLGITVNGGEELSVAYTGEAIAIETTGTVKDADGNEVSGITAVVTIKLGEDEVSEIREAGVYTVTVTYTGTDSEYESGFELKYTVTVRGDYDLSGITFENVTLEYDKEKHSIEITGELPEGVTVTYEGNEVSEIGEYTITAKFTHANPDYNAIPDMTATLTITKRKVTLVIDPLSSEVGEELAELTATITEGSILEGDTPYVLICAADKDTVGEYTVTWEYAEDYAAFYEITCEYGVYIVSKKADDPNGGGSIDMPTDIETDFKVIQSDTQKEYPQIYGFATGYYAQLWYKNEDGTLGDEYTGEINCILTLKVPDAVIKAICGDGEQTKEAILEKLKVYCIDGDGDAAIVKNYTLARREDESWIVKFNYNGKFRTEVVFNAYGIEVEPSVPEESANSSLPSWVFIAIGAGILLLVLLAVIIALSRRRRSADDYYDDYDDDDDYDDYDDDDY